MMQPLVSVVVPVYNVEQYLDRCVNSIVNQTYSKLEIILVDDGSPDNCPAMCDAWAERDERIRVVHKKNAGLGMARNTGIENASGKYIFFFDSDDYVDKTVIEKCVRSAEKHNADTVIFGRCDVYPDGKVRIIPVTGSKFLFCGKEVNNDLLSQLFTYKMGVGVSACGKMFTLETIRQNGLRFLSEREVISEDTFFVIQFFAAASTAVIVPESLYYYYKRENSLSRTFRSDRQIKNDVFINQALNCAQKLGLSNEVTDHLKVRYHFYTIAAMKQIMVSDLSEKERKKELLCIFRSETLQKTLTRSVLSLEKTTQKIFFYFLKIKCFTLCFWMLQLRNRNVQ